METRVLTVEDDDAIRTVVRLALEDEGWGVLEADNGEDALEIFRAEGADVVLIDIMLPGMNGFEVCRSIRRTTDVPIIMVTARSDTHDVVAGLEAGADDYLTKPFHVEELMARINALMRRAGGHAKPQVTLGPFTIDLSGQRVLRGDDEVELTTFEYKVLNYFVMHPGEVVTKSELAEHIYEEDADRDSNVIEVFVGRLRRKLDPDGTLNPIETLRGRGYRLALVLTP